MDMPNFTAEVFFKDQGDPIWTTRTVAAWTAHAAIDTIKAELRAEGKTGIKVRSTPLPDKFHNRHLSGTRH
jgi:hypothetical protein